MLDIGLAELLIILAVALIVLGPKKLPEVARSLGRGLAQLRRASEDLRRSILLDEDPLDRGGTTDTLPYSSVQRRPNPLSDEGEEEPGSDDDSDGTEPAPTETEPPEKKNGIGG